MLGRLAVAKTLEIKGEILTQVIWCESLDTLTAPLNVLSLNHLGDRLLSSAGAGRGCALAIMRLPNPSPVLQYLINILHL